MKNKIMALILLLTVTLPVVLSTFGVIALTMVTNSIVAFGIWIVIPVVAIRLAFKK